MCFIKPKLLRCIGLCDASGAVLLSGSESEISCALLFAIDVCWNGCGDGGLRSENESDGETPP